MCIVVYTYQCMQHMYIYLHTNDGEYMCVYSMFWEEICARMVVRMRYVMDACDPV